MFVISDKVVCVGCDSDGVESADWDPSVFRAVGPYPVKHQVYVVEALIDEGTGLRLVGHTAFHIPTGLETGWWYRVFRKLDEIKAENALRAAIDLGIPHP